MTPEAREEYGIASADCREAGHIDGCPGAAGGDHEVRVSYLRCSECGDLLDGYGRCELHGTLDPEFDREGQPEFNGAFDRW